MTIEQMRESILAHMGVGLGCPDGDECLACQARRDELEAFERAIVHRATHWQGTYKDIQEEQP